MDTFIGLDLGQLVDYTAAVVVRRSLAIDPGTGHPERDSRGRLHYRFDVSAIRRYPLGTSYTDIVRHVVGQLGRPELGRRPRLVIDGTGVGVAVVEMFRSALKPLADSVECYAVTITAGRAVTPIHRYEWHVAKIQLCGAIRAALESGRLKVPKELDSADVLRRELQDFKSKLTDAGNETFSAREGAHDDLVLATALPVWLAGLPFLEMAADDDDEWLRSRERDALSREAREIEEAEAEALARERGIVTAKMKAEREELDRLAREDINNPIFWGE